MQIFICAIVLANVLRSVSFSTSNTFLPRLPIPLASSIDTHTHTSTKHIFCPALTQSGFQRKALFLSRSPLRCSGDNDDLGQQEPYTLIKDSAHDQLRKWAREVGVKWQGWDVAHFPELDVRGVVALNDIPPGQPLVTVPLSAGITLEETTLCPFPSNFAHQEAWDACPRWEFKLALNLFWEYSRGQDSPRFSFIQTMPRSSDSLRLYPEDVLRELQDEALVERLVKWRKLCADEWARVFPLLSASCSCGETDYYWALDMVSSRTFCVERGDGGGCLYGMYPLADMFNHRFGSTQLSISKGCFSIVKEEDVRAGEQILVSYGAIDNSWLLQTYGFVDEENDMHGIRFAAETLQTAAAELLGAEGSRRCKALSEKVFPGFLQAAEARGDTLCVYRTGEGEELMKYLRALLLSPEDLILASSESTSDAHQVTKSRVLAGSTVSLENECRAWRVLAAAAEAMLNRKPTSLDEDQEALLALDEQILLGVGDPVANARLFNCILFRMMDKGLLLDCMQRTTFYAQDSEARGRLPAATILSIET